MKYEVIKTKRRSSAIQIKNGSVIVRVPLKMNDADVRLFVEKHRNWIEKQLEKQKKSENAPKLTKEEILQLTEKACKIIPERVKYYAEQMNVTYGKITIKHQKTRWGSCSSKGNLNFNCLLMLAPDEVLDSVIVHELCHLKEMNHSKSFYNEVLKVYPDYYKWHNWLKENGDTLINRITGE